MVLGVVQQSYELETEERTAAAHVRWLVEGVPAGVAVVAVVLVVLVVLVVVDGLVSVGVVVVVGWASSRGGAG